MIEFLEAAKKLSIFCENSECDSCPFRAERHGCILQSRTPCSWKDWLVDTPLTKITFIKGAGLKND